MAKNKTYKLTTQQDQFIFSDEHFTCIKGTWGCGKSLAGLLVADLECQTHPDNLFLIIRKEWVDLRDSTLRDWITEIGRPVVNNEVRYPNGSILMFRHGDDINALKNANLGGALMVQAEEMSEEDFWFLNGRLRRKSGTRQLRLECNYDGHNWIYKLFNKQKIGKLITTNTFDNEANLPPDYIPNLKKLPKRLQERHLYGSDADAEGLVFDEFRQAKHIVQPFEIPSEWERFVSLDHGVTNPTAALWFAVDFDGRVYIYDEHYQSGKTVSEHAAEIKKRNNKGIEEWLIDPACRAKISSKSGSLYSVIDEYRDYGLNFRPADNNVLAGINRVNEYFKADRLFIFKNCLNLLDEINAYKWDRVKEGAKQNEPDRPKKHKDHACDAMRYGIMSRPDSPEVEPEPIKKNTVAYFQRLEEQQSEYDEVFNG